MAPKKESIKKTGSIIAADVAQETPEVGLSLANYFLI